MSARPTCFMLAVLLVATYGARAAAHHSFSMYDSDKTYVLTGVVTRVSPDPSHLQIFFGVLDEAREKVIPDDNGEPIIRSVELRGSAQVASDGITVEAFPPGTIFSIGVHDVEHGELLDAIGMIERHVAASLDRRGRARRRTGAVRSRPGGRSHRG